jgi:hypothetical protein
MSTFPIIEKLGGRRAVAALIVRDGRPLSPDALRMWAARGRIPGYAIQEMLTLAEQRGIRVTAEDFQAVTPQEAA